MSKEKNNSTIYENIINNIIRLKKLRNIAFLYSFIIMVNYMSFIFGKPLSKLKKENKEYDSYIVIYYKADCKYSKGLKILIEKI